ncbi:MAG: aldo/keto reductase [Eubacteriales bacterium]
MQYRRFGKTNEMVSALGFGCMRLPLIPGGDTTKIDEKKATELIRYAIDNGVNYIDTAYTYHGTGMAKGGESEPFVGRVLKDGYREKVNLATKLPSWLINSREDMDKYLNEQLKRLDTDFIDFYLVHSLNKTHFDNVKKLGVGEFLDKAIKDGRIKYAGFSFHDNNETFNEIVDFYDWSFCQIQYNYLDEDFQAGIKGLRYAAKKDLGITIMEPLRGGKLAEGIPKEVENVFGKANIKRSPASWALRWVWNHPQVSTLLSGMNSMDQLTENLDIANDAKPNSLSEEELRTIKEAKNAFISRTRVNCTACGYCMPCPSGVNIPACFNLYNNYHIFGREDEYNFFIGPKHRASCCVECGKCETHCPQGISIREELKKVKALFE